MPYKEFTGFIQTFNFVTKMCYVKCVLFKTERMEYMKSMWIRSFKKRTISYRSSLVQGREIMLTIYVHTFIHIQIVKYEVLKTKYKIITLFRLHVGSV